MKKSSLILSILLCMLTACVTDDETTGGGSLVNTGDRVPDFALTAQDGSMVTAASLEGRAYVLSFFDTKCPDCRKELQVLQQLYDQYKGTVTLLNVPRSETEAQVQAYWEEAGLSMPYHIPHDKDLYYRFATMTVPRTYIVGGEGKVLASFDDNPTASMESLDQVLRPLVGQNEGDVSLRLRVRVSDSNRGVDEFYFHNEYTISRLEVFFFNADTKKLFSRATLKELTQAETPYDAEYDITYIFEDIRLRAGKYDIFAIANYDYSPTEIDDEEDFLNIIDNKTYQTGIEANIPDKGPVMTNGATSLLNVDLEPWINKSYILSVDMERVMAKLQIGVSKNTFILEHNQRKYAEINITNYKMVNLNTAYYLFQHKDSLTELGEKPVFTIPEHFGDYRDEGEQYVVDPYFYEKRPNTAAASFFRDIYREWYGTFDTSNFASMPAADNYGYAYILENTSFKTSQKNGYSPGIVFKAAVSPVFVYLYDNQAHALKEEYRPEYWPNTIYLWNYNFYGSIQAINVAAGTTLDELATYTDARLKTYGIKQSKFNMGVYETYYTYWIRHRNASNEMDPMEYGIVRNNFYKLIVTGVTDVGSSSITPDIMRDNDTAPLNGE